MLRYIDVARELRTTYYTKQCSGCIDTVGADWAAMGGPAAGAQNTPNAYRSRRVAAALARMLG